MCPKYQATYYTIIFFPSFQNQHEDTVMTLASNNLLKAHPKMQQHTSASLKSEDG
jgi:hypothetical protein